MTTIKIAPLIHRVIEVNSNGKICMKSDFHGQADLVCTESEVIGQITALQSRLGFTIPLDSQVIQLIFSIIMHWLSQVRKLL